jgi:hypothetical protein
LEVWSFEQGSGRANRVGRIGDDDIVFVLVLGEELESITDENSDSGVFVAFGHFG